VREYMNRQAESQEIKHTEPLENWYVGRIFALPSWLSALNFIIAAVASGTDGGGYIIVPA